LAQRSPDDVGDRRDQREQTLSGSPTPAAFHHLTTAAQTQLLMTGGRMHPRRTVRKSPTTA